MNRASLSFCCLGVRDPAHLARSARHCVRGVFRRPRSPWPGPFPPPPPPPARRRCSAASPVLRARPTSHDRASRDYGLGLPARPARHHAAGDRGISRFSRMEIPCMPGSLTARGPLAARDGAAPMLPSAYPHDVGTPDYLISRLNSPACTYPCPRFAAPSRNANGRGRDGPSPLGFGPPPAQIPACAYYRTGLLPWVRAWNRSSGQGCRICG